MKVVRTAVKAEPEVTPKSEPDTEAEKKAEKNVYQKNDNSAAAAAPTRYMVKRTMNSSAAHIEVRECVAEKVTSRRLNTKRNTYEYYVKWAEFEGTWEPKSHFEKAPELITECERKLAQQKAAALANASSAVAAASPNAAGRPERTSKARAVNTLKSWLNTGEQAGQSALSPSGNDLKRKNTDSEAGESSQDESFGAGSPSPNKQLKIASASSQIVQKVVGGQVRYFQKAANGSPTAVPTSPNSAEVVIDKNGDKASGVRRKPGVVVKSPVTREAQVKVVGRNETTSSGIVRVGKAAAPSSPGGTPSPVTSPVGAPRMQKIIQNTRTPSGSIIKRTIYRTIPGTPGTPSTPTQTAASAGATKPGITAARPAVASATASPRTPYQVNKTTAARTPMTTPATANAAYKISPSNQRVVRTPTAKPLSGKLTNTTPSPTAGRVVRSSPATAAAAKVGVVAAKESEEDGSGDAGEYTLCPVTGKLITKGQEGQSAEDADSELQRLLTNEEEEAAAAAAGSNVNSTEIHELIQNEDGSPVMVTGEDGTVYQVAGKNAEGQTLLLTQGEDGEQQCVIMASPEDGAAAGDGAHNAGEGETQMLGVDGDSQDGQITAELVQADEPSADGTRRVVLLLPDGNLMVSELNEEQYQQFNLGA